MILLILFLILIKVLVYKKMTEMHIHTHASKLCPKGYFGLNADPFNCNAYYMCPHRIHLFCDPDHEFDLNTVSCRPIILHGDGCTAHMYRNLLL
ncbi:ChtB1 [Parapoynx stagnalis nucleopolyhedrovirus]|uniref:ChtB1 n=1 Tax=Parapoynx stagnalis nucleopolyhedrovirus TaxID=2993413 RepID=A0A9E7YBX9_9ABAC|nr:ChtB1 [Parapoynx stagnalis nucleopolyhedrovirus]